MFSNKDFYLTWSVLLHYLLKAEKSKMIAISREHTKIVSILQIGDILPDKCEKYLFVSLLLIRWENS